MVRYVILALLFVISGISVGLVVTVRALREQSQQMSRVMSGQAEGTAGYDWEAGAAGVSLSRQTAAGCPAKGASVYAST